MPRGCLLLQTSGMPTAHNADMQPCCTDAAADAHSTQQSNYGCADTATSPTCRYVLYSMSFSVPRCSRPMWGSARSTNSPAGAADTSTVHETRMTTAGHTPTGNTPTKAPMLATHSHSGELAAYSRLVAGSSVEHCAHCTASDPVLHCKGHCCCSCCCCCRPAAAHPSSPAPVAAHRGQLGAGGQS